MQSWIVRRMSLSSSVDSTSGQRLDVHTYAPHICTWNVKSIWQPLFFFTAIVSPACKVYHRSYLYFTEMCISTRSKHTEINSEIYGHFFTLPYVLFLNSNLSELHMNLDFSCIDLRWTLLTFSCQMQNELRSTWTYFVLCTLLRWCWLN